MVYWKLKSCPRCTGDIFIEDEKNGWDEACLACGYRKSASKKMLGQITQIEENRKSYVSFQRSLNNGTFSQ
jgi:DNA-directed RNA polymerase subunit M/transcription elongation factor TFIIS